jgi:ABC-2 type transport system permease protein
MTTTASQRKLLPDSSPVGRSLVSVFLSDVGFGLRSAARTPFPLVTGIFIPLFFNVMFSWLQGDEVVGGLPGVTRTTGTIIVFVVASAGYFNMVIGITQAREKGLLKRVRQSPVPRTIHLLARITVALVVSGVSVLLMVAVSVLGFGLEIRMAAVPGLVLAFVLASIASSALGIALTRLVPTLEASIVLGTATLFPLLFISGVFFPLEMPAVIETVTDYLPFAPMSDLINGLLDPSATGAGIDGRALAVVAAWAVIGMFLAVRFVRWEPRK